MWFLTIQFARKLKPTDAHWNVILTIFRLLVARSRRNGRSPTELGPGGGISRSRRLKSPPQSKVTMNNIWYYISLRHSEAWHYGFWKWQWKSAIKMKHREFFSFACSHFGNSKSGVAEGGQYQLVRVAENGETFFKADEGWEGKNVTISQTYNN